MRRNMMLLQNNSRCIQTTSGENSGLVGLYVLDGCKSKAYVSGIHTMFVGGVLLDVEPGSFWLSSIATVILLKDKINMLAGSSVLELGAGSGLPSRFLAKSGFDVTASDCDVPDLGVEIKTQRICWDDLSGNDGARYDVIIASDCIYKTTYKDGLLDAIARYKKEKILVVNPFRDGVDQVGYALQEMFDGLRVEERRLHLNGKYYIDLCVMTNI